MPSVIHSFEETPTETGVPVRSFVILIVILMTVGIAGGYLFSKFKGGTKTVNAPKGTIVGIADKKTFKDSAEGILKEGGIGSEGNFHLQRPGGVSQNVYLTSTTVDLSQYIDKKVRVWGATFEGDKAGWLMDVGLVEILQ